MTALPRAACPNCGRETAYSQKGPQVTFRRHKNPDGDLCPTGGTPIEFEEALTPGQVTDAADGVLRQVLLDRALAIDARPSHQIGRVPNLTPQVVSTIVDALLQGHYQETAAVLAGISDSTFQNWKARGVDARKQLEADPTAELPPAEVPFLEFLAVVEEARAHAEGHYLRTVRTMAEGGVVKRTYTDPKTGEEVVEFFQPSVPAATWWLERSFPHRWGRRPVEVSGPDGGAIEVNVTARERLASRIEEMAERAADAA